MAENPSGRAGFSNRKIIKEFYLLNYWPSFGLESALYNLLGTFSKVPGAPGSFSRPAG
jgi:hypothetical protein